MPFATSFRDRLLRDWYQPRTAGSGGLSLALAPLSWLFGALAALRRGLFRIGLLRSIAVPVPVIVIGNIAVGGTGKTPLAIALVAALRMRGRRPGIVSRGYGSSGTEPRQVDAGSSPGDVGDEPLLLAQTGAPVWVGADRVEAALDLLATHPEVDTIVSDDGLQHYALARDCEVVVMDGARGLGNARLLPAGPLREPPSRLRSVDAIVINGRASDPAIALPAGVPVFPMTLAGDRFVNLADGTTASAAGFAGRNVHAVAGIGHPDRFFAQIASLGIAATTHPFPDHHTFAAGDFDFPGADAIVMTAKDAIKCSAFADPRMWSLPVSARIDPAFVERVVDRAMTGAAARNADRKTEF